MILIENKLETEKKDLFKEGHSSSKECLLQGGLKD